MTASSAHGIPTTSLGAPLFNPNILAPGYLFYATGAYDDLTNEKRGKGAFIEIEQVDAGQGTLEGQFFEHVYIHGGAFGCHNEGKGDWVEMMAYAPASTPSNVPGGTGNAQKVGVLSIDNKSGTFQAGEVLVGGTSGHTAAVAAVLSDTSLQVAHIGTGAFQDDEVVTGQTSGATADVNGAISANMIVPASGDGFWNVDGSTLTKGEINSGLAPVPNKTDPQNGYWNWDPDEDPSITPAAGDGAYDLYDIAIPLVRQANRIGCLLHEKDCCPDELKGKKLLPHWKIKFTVNRGAAGTLLVQFMLKTSRKTTVNMDDLA